MARLLLCAAGGAPCHLRVDCELGLDQSIRYGLLKVLDADRVDSVPLVRRRLLLAIEDVTEVRAAPVAYNLNGTSVRAHADMAILPREEAAIERVPTTVLELGRRRVERHLASAAPEVTVGRKELMVLSTAGRLRAALAEHLELGGRQRLAPLRLALAVWVLRSSRRAESGPSLGRRRHRTDGVPGTFLPLHMCTCPLRTFTKFDGDGDLSLLEVYGPVIWSSFMHNNMYN